MIKRLRRKFMFISAVLMFLIFCLILFALVYSNIDAQEQAGYHRLELVLERGYVSGQGQMESSDRGESQYNSEPGFCVKVDKQGNATLTNMQYYTEISAEMMDQAVRYACEAERAEGMIRSLQLRYVRRVTLGGTLRVAFADISVELEQYKILMGDVLIIISIGIIAVAALSRLLAAYAIRPVEKAWIQQKQFVADASHEIKTPLTIILTNTDILLAREQDSIESQRKWLEYIRTEAERMRELVEDMLFLAKSDAGKDAVEHTDLNLSELVWNAALPFEAVAWERGVSIEAEVAPNAYIKGNGTQISHLLMILLDNACKYSPKGSTVYLQLTVQQDHPVLSVRNACEEVLSKEHLERLFDRFYRADSARSRDTGGYGLGLSIAKTIAENHGGRIRARSDAEVGMQITVEFAKYSRKNRKE